MLRQLERLDHSSKPLKDPPVVRSRWSYSWILSRAAAEERLMGELWRLVIRSTDSHAGAAQLLADVPPDVVDGYRLQLLVALNLLVDGAFAGSQFPLVSKRVW